MNELEISENKTMSSSQLAELLGYDKAEINKKLRSMFEDKIAKEQISVTLRDNGQVSEYHLPELESIMFVAKHNDDFLEKITEYWIARKPKLSTLEMVIVSAQNQIKIEKEQAAQAKELEIQNSKIEKIENTLDSRTNYYTITAYCRVIGVSLPLKEANKKGRASTLYSKEHGVSIGSVPDERFGSVNSYHVSVLQFVFCSKK